MIERRIFLRLPILPATLPGVVHARSGRQASADERSERALRLRQQTAVAQNSVIAEGWAENGDEISHARWIAAFTKALPHNQLGEVQPGAYETLLEALRTGDPADFEKIARGSGRRLKCPQGAYAYSLEGGDPHRFSVPPAPSFSSGEMAAETVEMYWMALCRDVPFREYDVSTPTAQAAEELSTTPHALFRGPTPGDLSGPYISQFLVRPINTVSTVFEQRYRTAAPGFDFVTDAGEWLQIQNGIPPWREYFWDPTPRYIRNGRDLAEWVHYDFLYQAFLNAALILLNYRPEAILFENRSVLSESNPYKHSKVQDGFLTFGQAQVVDWLGRVTTAALKAAWAQKWLVHRRLRPETFAGRVHQSKTKVSEYPIHPALLNSAAVEAVYQRFGSYLLPQAYPEGSPIHPSYPGGHATVAGACSVILKAFFDENALIADCVHASADGLSLEPCPSSFVPTIGAEVNKLVFNIANGRTWAGIHYRSDSNAGVRLGEDVAISILQDLAPTCTETFDGFAFTRLDGTKIRITPEGRVLA